MKIEIRSEKGDEGYTIDIEYTDVRGFYASTNAHEDTIRIYINYPKSKDLKPFEPPMPD